jgi:hypothetical protein
MTRNALIKHKEVAIICEENGPLLSFFGVTPQLVIANCNAFVSQIF